MPDQLTGHEADVRRLLADARHDEPMPAEVVGRLDVVLADLAAERRSETPAETSPVTGLADARRRRRGASLLLAAAAVVVAGVGIGQVLTPNGDSSESMDAAGPVDAGAEDATRDEAPHGEEMARSTPPLAPESGSETAPAAMLDRRTLAKDLLAARRPVTQGDASYSLVRPTCGVSDDGPGQWLSVTLDGEAGVAVFRPVAAGEQVVDVFLCHTSSPAESVRLPAR